MYRNLFVCIFGFYFLAVSPCTFAKISIAKLNNTSGVVVVSLDEEVTAEDAAQLKKFSDAMIGYVGTNWRILAKLNSTGGNVRAALEIGRILRKVDSMATVGIDSVCFSSCVYILAGALHRGVDGKVGIHRPYDPVGKETSAAKQKASYTELGIEIKAYLNSMNIPLKLYDDELFISPENIKILNFNELQNYGLNQNDPFQEEADSTVKAKKLGISRSELASREAQAKINCPWNGDYSSDTTAAVAKCRAAYVSSKKTQ